MQISSLLPLYFCSCCYRCRYVVRLYVSTTYEVVRENTYVDLTLGLRTVNPLTYDLRSRILGRKRKRARAALEPFA